MAYTLLKLVLTGAQWRISWRFNQHVYFEFKFASLDGETYSCFDVGAHNVRWDLGSAKRMLNINSTRPDCILYG